MYVFLRLLFAAMGVAVFLSTAVAGEVAGSYSFLPI
jgi:hypothetical protein